MSGFERELYARKPNKFSTRCSCTAHKAGIHSTCHAAHKRPTVGADLALNQHSGIALLQISQIFCTFVPFTSFSNALMNKRIQSGDVKPLIRDYSLSNVVLKNRDLLHILSVVMFECFNQSDSRVCFIRCMHSCLM